MPTQNFATEQIGTLGSTSTELDFVWKIKIKEAGWIGHLDCQSFFHFIKFSDGKKDINQYLDAQECDDWHDVLIKGSGTHPLCLNIGAEVGVQKADCNVRKAVIKPL